MSEPRLTPTSYAVLGLVKDLQPVTPYGLKNAARIGVGNFWSFTHTQLYSECDRLADLGLLDEEREATGRRRRLFRITPEGAGLLADWREELTHTDWELRDAALVKLFFGADVEHLAEVQIAGHERRLAGYEELREQVAGLPRGKRLALEAGIGHEREYLRFWRAVAAGDDPAP